MQGIRLEKSKDSGKGVEVLEEGKREDWDVSKGTEGREGAGDGVGNVGKRGNLLCGEHGLREEERREGVEGSVHKEVKRNILKEELVGV